MSAGGDLATRFIILVYNFPALARSLRCTREFYTNPTSLLKKLLKIRRTCNTCPHLRGNLSVPLRYVNKIMFSTNVCVCDTCVYVCVGTCEFPQRQRFVNGKNKIAVKTISYLERRSLPPGARWTGPHSTRAGNVFPFTEKLFVQHTNQYWFIERFRYSVKLSAKLKHMKYIHASGHTGHSEYLLRTVHRKPISKIRSTQVCVSTVQAISQYQFLC